MRFALISDIHANLPALAAVLADIEARPDIDAIYHLGSGGLRSVAERVVSMCAHLRHTGGPRLILLHG